MRALRISHLILAAFGFLAAVLLLIVLQGCEDNPTAVEDDLTEDRARLPHASSRPDAVDMRADSAFYKTQGLQDIQTLTLPFTGIVNSGVPGFEIRQDGGGIAGRFEIRNPNSAAIALDGVSSGIGHALLAWNLGRGRGAVVITSNSANTLPALDVSSQSLGSSTLASAADIRANNTSSTAPAVQISALGRGALLVANHKGSAGSLAIFQLNGANKIRFTRFGKAFFNGGTQTGGADVAEAFEVEGRTDTYEPGDVLAISTRTDRTVEISREPYSTLVAGVYATKPGVLLTERDIEDSLDDTVPMGVVGVIPTKVSAENGPIRRGDLLVSAARHGHAMRADVERLGHGMVLGKALENFTGPGTGKIRVLVNVR